MISSLAYKNTSSMHGNSEPAIQHRNEVLNYVFYPIKEKRPIGKRFCLSIILVGILATIALALGIISVIFGKLKLFFIKFVLLCRNTVKNLIMKA